MASAVCDSSSRPPWELQSTSKIVIASVCPSYVSSSPISSLEVVSHFPPVLLST
jgi:hypothetical protein